MRTYWISIAEKLSKKPLFLLSQQELKRQMVVELKDTSRKKYTYLELLSRILCGISPWLELNTEDRKEQEIINEIKTLAQKSLDIATNPSSLDYMNFNEGDQPLVDAAFLAQAILRAPNKLWHDLNDDVKMRLKDEIKKARKIKPYFCNWILFSAMIEVFLYFIGDDWDEIKVDWALKFIENWYKGDGIYGDGPEFQWDYYNSYVIYPMLIDILKIISSINEEWEAMKSKVIKRAQRYAIILERLISPEGTFPPIGRSITYRSGVFHLLSQLSLYHLLPIELKPSQVRCALTAVMKNIFKEGVSTFGEDGWLKIGLVGNQPNLGENYISTGSLYLCSTIFLPLGLNAKDSFWSDKDEMWTSYKIWNGINMEADKSIHI